MNWFKQRLRPDHSAASIDKTWQREFGLGDTLAMEHDEEKENDSMFDMNNVGQKIAAKRREKNMTQMGLADAMGVSFQAVSNWERGHSMPDISKLPELTALLGLSIDELLTNTKSTRLIKHIINEDETADYIKAEEVDARTVASVAPLLKPKQTESFLEQVLTSMPDHVDLSDLDEIAPFVSESFLAQWAEKVVSVDNIKKLASLAPFLSEQTMDHLVDKLTQQDVTAKEISPLAPFLSESTLDKLIRKSLGSADYRSISPLAPFLSKSTFDYVVDQVTDGEVIDMKQLSGLAPFMSSETLDKLAEKVIQSANPKDLTTLAPFMSKEALQRCASTMMEKYGIKGIIDLAPFL